MSLGEKLLELTVEYKAAKDSRADSWPSIPGTPIGRDLEAIAADYEVALRELLTGKAEG